MICRICSGELTLVLDLGYHPPSDAFLSREDLKHPETYYPLTFCKCVKCGLFQLGYVVPPDVLYNKSYPYETGSNKQGVEHFKAFAFDTVKRFNLNSNHLVLDIGSNDGTLLKAFKDLGCRVLGIEPVPHLAEKALKNGIPTFNIFFPNKILENADKPQVITATNVFAHVDDLHSFVRSVGRILPKNGMLVIEAPYIWDMIHLTAFDTIYHEHLSYLGIIPLKRLFEQYDMEIINVSHHAIHGWSMRYYIARRGAYIVHAEEIDRFVMLENQLTDDVIDKFAERVKNTRLRLIDLLRHLKSMENRIVGVSAPAKGNTLLNYCRIGTETLDFITDIVPYKIGRVTPGSHIPVVSDNKLLDEQPDYALILAWNWADQIMNNLKGFKGKWIIPIPEPGIV
jgi:SAM-dependent methyltransferase